VAPAVARILRPLCRKHFEGVGIINLIPASVKRDSPKPRGVITLALGAVSRPGAGLLDAIHL
jgi:hypothetical protein